jgi:uridine phosphorylase
MNKQLITGLEPGEVAKYVFLCGEPERVPRIASAMSDAKMVRQAREYTVYSASLEGTPVTVASTGIGGPSTAILVEELSNLGAHTFLRIGTSGGIADGLEKGDFVIATGAVRADGTSKSYAWREYPAVANHEVVMALVDSANKRKARFDVGVCLSVDGFYSENKVVKDGKVAPMSQNGYMPSFMVDRLADAKRMNVKNIEMENGTIFTLCGLFGLRAGALCRPCVR